MVQLPLRGMGHRRIVPVLHPQQANGPQAVFPPFPRPRAKGRSRPPRLGRRGPDPAYASAPPRARSRARAGGADDRHQPGPGETAGAAPRPRAAPALFAGSEFRRARAGSGCAAAALWAAIQCRAYLERGVWGVAHMGRPSPSDEAPGRRARGHEERVSKPPAQTSGERARRPEGEGAAAAALPGLCRAWLFRGELLLHPLRGGLAAGCSCAAAHPPSGLFLVKIFGTGNDAACSVAAMHVALQVAVHVAIIV